MSKTERKLKAVSLILIAVLVFTAIFNVAFIGNVASAGGGYNSASSSVGTLNNGFVKSDMDFSSIREQYLNKELFQQSIASFDGDRWIIVKLSGASLYDKFEKSTRYNAFPDYAASVEGMQAEKSMKITHTEFLKKLQNSGIEYEFKSDYTALFNGVAIKVNASALNAIKKMSGVEGVYYSEYYDVPKVIANNDTNVYTTGIYDSSDLPVQGKGMVVAILDTGLDHTHEAFQTMPENGAWDLNYISSKVAEGKLNAKGVADDFYYNQKVPFAYDYADDDPNVYPSYSSHGTHVAGIVAGSSDYEVAPGEKFIGVAPEAQLVICKVFTDNLDSESLGGANSIGILNALEDCVTLGVDVINMSLGSSAGFSTEKGADELATLTNEIYGKIEKEGISLVVAASNDYSSGFGGGNGTNLATNPDSGTVGSPSTYSASLSVASINGQKSAYIQANATRQGADNPIAFITNANDEFSREIDFIDELYKLAARRRGVDSIPKGTDLTFKYVVISGVGADSSYTNAVLRELENLDTGIDGAIALVKRGDNTFEEKVLAAMGAGADAIIVYNNVAGTIRMSIGDIDNPIPTCSISMDAGKGFVDNAGRLGVGTLTVNSSFEAGPFMSEFSSWGPTPSLELKPEITAHGGQITSAVAGGYDKLSGTSMASPNMAGAVALLRQYLQEEYKLSGKALNERVNQVLMSTATIAKNEDNNPYSPRKQGAGLASIQAAINAESYITVKKNGEIRDKTKIELYDDPQKKGVYVLEFIVNNVTDRAQTYNPTTYVMTETMSTDNKTVAEKAYMLTDMSTITYAVGDEDFNSMTSNSGAIIVPANSKCGVRVTVTLGADAKNYLDTRFKNGMYVEGFVSLAAIGDTQETIGLPYLAFYGDWTDAPMFDYDQYEIAADEMDTNKPVEEKIKASAAATMPYGLYGEEKYILPLGSYIYTQDEDEVQVYPEREKIAISMYNDSLTRSIYELYMIYAGMLRGAAEMDLTITDETTGSVVYSDLLYNVRKSYAGGGSNRGAPVMIELNPYEWGLQNNSTYSVHVEGRLDYDMPANKTVERNSFDFPFTVDYEAPELLEYRIRYQSYTENKVVKYKIFMDIDVRDNQYVQTILPCYTTTRPDGLGDTEKVLTLLTEYPIPVMGQKGETSTVSFEITDIYEDFVKTGEMYLQVEDYAMNSVNYRILPGSIKGEDAMGDPDSIEFVEDENLVRMPSANDGVPRYTLTLQPYTLYTFNTVTQPENASLQGLEWTNSDGNAVAKAKGDQIFAGNSGITELRLRNNTISTSKKKTYAIVRVVIEGSGGRAPVLERIDFNAAIDGDDVAVTLSGPNAASQFNINPNQVVDLTWNWSPWYAEKPEVFWTTSNAKIVEVNENGQIRGIARGTAYISVTAMDRPSVSTMIKVEVGREYDVRNYTLYNYYGTGDIQIRDDLNIMYLSEDCFKGNTNITSVKLPDTLTEIPENAFMGCTNLAEIIIPGQCVTIKENAFYGCTSLKKITLGKFVDSEHNSIGDNYGGTIAIGRRAFYGCSALTTIENQKRLTTIYSNAFENCTALESIDISELRVVSGFAFKGCTSLKTVTTSKDTVFGIAMFEGCTSLESFDFYGNAVAGRMFANCRELKNITFHNPISSIGASAFELTKIENFTLPNGTVTLAEGAFSKSAITTLTLSPKTKIVFAGATPFATSSPLTSCDDFTAYAINGSSDFYSVEDGVLYNKNKTTLEAVPYGKKALTLPASVNTIAASALAGVNIASIDLSNVKNIGSFAFAGNTVITSVTLPSGLKAIPANLFDGCKNLKTVTAADNFAEVKTIGANAFRGCANLQRFTAENIETVGANAFKNTALNEIIGTNIKTVGANAFENSSLVNISMLALTSIGSEAFANISTLKTAELGAITRMGDSIFVGSTELTRVSFAEGTTRIGYQAFGSEKDVIGKTIEIILPTTVTYIDQLAFCNRTGLVNIDLSHVKVIDAMAFAYTGLRNVDLSNVEQIGFGAFAGTYLSKVDLPKAWIVGSNAFYDVITLKSVTFGALQRLGEDVFKGTAITTITLPDTFNSRTYDYSWTVEEIGLPDEIKVRKEFTYGMGALSGATKLTEIKANNDVFFDIDGVLYSRTEKGLILEQYPVARAAEDKFYKVADGTIMINSYAFTGVTGVEKVELPYTVNTIGTGAFMNCSVKEFVFNSVEAPTLLAEALTEEMFSDEDPLYLIFSRRGLAETNFYTNFADLAIITQKDVWAQLFLGIEYADTFEAASKLAEEFIKENVNFDLTMTIPRNAKGYNGIWEMFFETINTTENIMPDNTTHVAIDAIAALPSVEEIAAITDINAINTSSTYGKLAQAARKAYNAIVDAEQRALIADEFATLLNVERALRDRKQALGEKVLISSIVMSKRPNKIIYNVGEEFDGEGMILTAIYADGSEVELTGGNYEVSPRVMKKDTDAVTITYRDGDLSVSTQILVQVNSTGADDPAEDTTNGLSNGAKIGIGVGVAAGVIVIAGVVVLVLMLKKKKSSGNDGTDGGESGEKEEMNKEVSDTQEIGENTNETATENEGVEDAAEQASFDALQTSEEEQKTAPVAQTESAEDVQQASESATEITAEADDEGLSEENKND